MSARRYRINRDLPDGATAFLRTALEDYGWQRTDGNDWNFDWSFVMHDRFDYVALRPDQRVNHFPGIGPLHFKDELYYFLMKARRRARWADGWYDFFPERSRCPGATTRSAQWRGALRFASVHECDGRTFRSSISRA